MTLQASNAELFSRKPLMALGLEREIDQHDAVLLPRPIRRMIPISPMTSSPKPKVQSAMSAPSPADGSVDRIVADGSCFVEHAEDQIDRDDRRHDQDRRRDERLESLGVALEARRNGRGHVQRGGLLLHGGDGRADERSRADRSSA